jgi:hypothetical protein
MAVNKKRFNLTSVSVTLLTENGQDVYIGSAESIGMTIEQSTTTAHQANSKMPVEIVDGIIKISGKISRAQVDFDPHTTLIVKNGVNPYFNLVATESVSGKIVRVKNCKITGGIGIDISLSDYAKDEFSFEALDYELVNPV